MECLYAGVMLPNYWGGHHLAHVAVYVWESMTAQDVRQQIKNDLFESAVMGSEYEEALYDDYIASVDAMEISDQPFLGCEFDGESMAFFVFKKED